MGGGGWIYHTFFICENNRKNNKIMHCVDLLFFLSGSFEDMGIFHVFQISFDDLMISTHNSEKNPHIF